MRGLGRMIIAGATIIAAMSCHHCVRADAEVGTVVNIDNATILAASRQSETASLTTVSINYTGSFSQAEVGQELAFRADNAQMTDFGIETDDLLQNRTLYSSAILTDIAANRVEVNLSPVPREQRSLTAEIALSAPSERTGLGFDVGIAPRLSITNDGPLQTKRFGGEVRIGQNFDKRGQAGPISSWYLFAGADGEALVWEPDQERGLSVNEMALRDQVTVGDIQAGVSFQRGLGQLSLSYIRREVEYRERNLGASENEDFAGVSFTIKR